MVSRWGGGNVNVPFPEANTIGMLSALCLWWLHCPVFLQGQKVLIFFEDIQGPQCFSYVTMLHKPFYLRYSLSMQVMVFDICSLLLLQLSHLLSNWNTLQTQFYRSIRQLLPQYLLSWLLLHSWGIPWPLIFSWAYQWCLFQCTR